MSESVCDARLVTVVGAFRVLTFECQNETRNEKRDKDVSDDEEVPALLLFSF